MSENNSYFEEKSIQIVPCSFESFGVEISSRYSKVEKLQK